MKANKYSRGYFMPPEECLDWTRREYVEHAPVWCSVDLRDGNQALVNPMSLDEKVEFFAKLVHMGFKEIEIGFPAASDTEYAFCRKLIDDGLIPDDVTIQVLTQAREHIINKTFEAVKGAKKAIIHLYNSTSVAQREQVFRKSKEEIKNIAVEGATLLKKLADKTSGNFLFEYSPESFTGTEPEYALEVCNAVLGVWKPSPNKKVIINLPVTVEMSLPHVYASQVEYICKNIKYRDGVIISLHPHNDRGTAVADAELALLAGGERVEGTLFGNGERTGNVDIITLGMNMVMHGVEPKLDFSFLPELTEMYERLSGMTVSPRQPYSGALVFTAFSGSHQDAIAKGLACREKNKDGVWSVPYLPVDPADVGRSYDADVIRINSQSGKGGIGYVLENKYGFSLPAKMREHVGYSVKRVSDVARRELSTDEVRDVFVREYVNLTSPVELEYHSFSKHEGKVCVTMYIVNEGSRDAIYGEGNGQLDAAADALKRAFDLDFTIADYTEHALDSGSNSRACAYVGVNGASGKLSYGAGIDTDIMSASIKALIGAVNKLLI
ncbi:MAG: 2-isopropylmalate synthase [Clostridia bacterium]|nr:2-isopropylmalate synthase [Clostridia bacterium]